jgi:hypothetical protein
MTEIYSVEYRRDFVTSTTKEGAYHPLPGSQLVDGNGTKFQRLHPCFRGPATQWK